MKNEHFTISKKRSTCVFAIVVAASLFVSTSNHRAQADQSQASTTPLSTPAQTATSTLSASSGKSASEQVPPATPLNNSTEAPSVLTPPTMIATPVLSSPPASGVFTTLGTTAGPPPMQIIIAAVRKSAPLPQSQVPQAPAVAPSKAWLKLLGHGDNFQEGMVFEHEDGTSFASVNASEPIFNPASTTKLATSLAVLRKFGPEHMFVTEVRVSGEINKVGELQGDLYVSGDDMLFGDRQAHELAKILNKNKIKSISGDIYVPSDFSMNLTATGFAAGQQLLNALDPWFQKKHQGFNPHSHQAQVTIGGSLKLGSPTGETRIVATHSSPPLRDMLKVMLAYSDNDMAERFGQMIGGPDALTAFVTHDLGVPENEVHFASTSGLYVNRVSPHAMLTILKALRAEAHSNGLQLSSLLDVAGAEKGTLHKRFTGRLARTVIAKTGTLPETDMGVSALSGEVHTRRGTFLFVIFEKHGNVAQFRARQNNLVAQFEKDYGGPAPIAYKSFLSRIDQEDAWAQ